MQEEEFASNRPGQSTTSQQPSAGPEQKYCADCGKLILRRAEICPGCGCRQTPATSGARQPAASFNIPRSPELQSSFVSQMAILLILNFFWNGLGNLAIGDKRGWKFGFANWLVFALTLVTFGIPSILFFAYCGYVGHQFLVEAQTAQDAVAY